MSLITFYAIDSHNVMFLFSFIHLTINVSRKIQGQHNKSKYFPDKVLHIALIAYCIDVYFINENVLLTCGMIILYLGARGIKKV